MITKEELETLINKIKESMDETASALASEDLLTIVSNYNTALEEITSLNKKLNSALADKEELLKANGKLFQKIGFDDPKKEESKEDSEEEIKIEDIIDEKGDFINE